MASGDDYYKEYKRKMRENNKANYKKFIPLILLFVILIPAAIIAAISISKAPLDNSAINAEKESGAKPLAGSIESNTNQESLNQESENRDSTMSYEEFLEQYKKEHPDEDYSVNYSSDNNSEDDNTEAYRKLQEQIAQNEAEKQRIAEEQAALQKEQSCNSIKNNYDQELRNAQNSYNQAIRQANSSCSGQGGCPARTNAENEYNRLIQKDKQTLVKKKETAELFIKETKTFIYYLVALAIIKVLLGI